MKHLFKFMFNPLLGHDGYPSFRRLFAACLVFIMIRLLERVQPDTVSDPFIMLIGTIGAIILLLIGIITADNLMHIWIKRKDDGGSHETHTTYP